MADKCKFKRGDRVEYIPNRAVKGTVRRVDWFPDAAGGKGAWILSLDNGNYGGESHFELQSNG